MESDDDREQNVREKFKKERHDPKENPSNWRRGSKRFERRPLCRPTEEKCSPLRKIKEEKRSPSPKDSYKRQRDSYRGGRTSLPEKENRNSNNYRGRPSFQGAEDRRRKRYSSPNGRGSPPYRKRQRIDWDQPDAAELDPYYQPPHITPPQPRGLTQPPKLTFKQFLNTQDENIDEKEAAHKYAEYKEEFQRQQLSNFFVAHMKEDWFSQKYHPDKIGQTKAERVQLLQKRLQAFWDLRSWMDGLTLDISNSEKIIQLLDGVVVKLEGGTHEDLLHLKGEEDPAEATAQEEEGPMENQENEQKKEDITESQEDSFQSDSEIESPESPSMEPAADDEPGAAVSPPAAETPKEREALHKTQSIFFRSVPVNVTKKEVEELCKNMPGFLRVSLTDPQPDKNFIRRGWVTFRDSADIKQICLDLSYVKLREIDMGAIVNRVLSRRVRSVDGHLGSPRALESHLDLAKSLVLCLDQLCELGHGRELIQELEAGCPVIQALDLLLLYLRIVHSVDFYKHTEYQKEDEMPSRLGIIHVRDPLPEDSSSKNVDFALEVFQKKHQEFVAQLSPLTDEELVKLGKKDIEQEKHKFMEANIRQVDGEKWMCLISNKKFKAKMFVLKHIENKHKEELQEVVTTAQYFNNYLQDPRRPQLPEHPPLNTMEPAFSPMFYGPVGRPPPHHFMDRRRRDPRTPIGYHDLDAPAEDDQF